MSVCVCVSVFVGMYVCVYVCVCVYVHKHILVNSIVWSFSIYIPWKVAQVCTQTINIYVLRVYVYCVDV